MLKTPPSFTHVHAKTLNRFPPLCFFYELFFFPREIIFPARYLSAAAWKILVRAAVHRLRQPSFCQNTQLLLMSSGNWCFSRDKGVSCHFRSQRSINGPLGGSRHSAHSKTPWYRAGCRGVSVTAWCLHPWEHIHLVGSQIQFQAQSDPESEA